jgi:hypothetical protein
MPITRRRLLTCGFSAIVSLVAMAAPLGAQTAGEYQGIGPAPHVRPLGDLRALVTEAARRSPAIRALLVQLETLDVIVYVRTRAFQEVEREGHVALLGVNAGHRYLVIELACGLASLTQMATLGHELFHAVEIAGEPSIVDARSLAAFYERIGRETGNWGGRRTFETNAAAEAGQRARRELLMNNARSGNGS